MKMFSDLWEKALFYLEDDLNAYVMKTWIKDLKPAKHEDNDYYFTVELELQKRTVEERFLKNIKVAMEEAFEEINGTTNGHITPHVILEDQLNSTSSKSDSKSPEEAAAALAFPLDQDYTFDTFIVGDSNRFAAQMAKAVAEQPNKNYNPLFLYSAPSLGKSHLIQAIGNYILANNPSAKIVYVSSETFLNEFISMIRMSGKQAKSNDDFRVQFQKRYRDIDVLLIDDIQFLSGKESIQEEFFHTFDSLHRHGKRIVITSDKSPRELDGFEERLLSRFEWGIIVDIKPPELETRVAILMEKAHQYRKNIPDMPEIENEVYYYIASSVTSNIRLLESKLRKVIYYSKLSDSDNSVIDITLAQEALAGDPSEPGARVITPESIISFVAKQYNISKDDILSQKKNRAVAYPRMLAMYLIRTICNTTYQQIGETFGRHYSTVMHAEETITKECSTNKDTKDLVDDFVERIKQ